MALSLEQRKELLASEERSLNLILEREKNGTTSPKDRVEKSNLETRISFLKHFIDRDERLQIQSQSQVQPRALQVA